jgi:hypothetical protein
MLDSYPMSKGRTQRYNVGTLECSLACSHAYFCHEAW